jgi:hypothetical protein
MMGTAADISNDLTIRFDAPNNAPNSRPWQGCRQTQAHLRPERIDARNGDRGAADRVEQQTSEKSLLSRDSNFIGRIVTPP